MRRALLAGIAAVSSLPLLAAAPLPARADVVVGYGYYHGYYPRYGYYGGYYRPYYYPRAYWGYPAWGYPAPGYYYDPPPPPVAVAPPPQPVWTGSGVVWLFPAPPAPPAPPPPQAPAQ